MTHPHSAVEFSTRTRAILQALADSINEQVEETPLQYMREGDLIDLLRCVRDVTATYEIHGQPVPATFTQLDARIVAVLDAMNDDEETEVLNR